jgi:hypothetical protein
MALMDLDKLRTQAQAYGLVFDLEYHAGRDTRTVHDAATGNVIACDDTKEHTKSLARIRLRQLADFGIPIGGLKLLPSTHGDVR